MDQTELDNAPMELRILKDGRVVLVAPDSELLEAAEAIITQHHQNMKESTPNDNSSSETTSQEKSTQRA
jgi:hypothetical protein